MLTGYVLLFNELYLKGKIHHKIVVVAQKEGCKGDFYEQIKADMILTSENMRL